MEMNDSKDITDDASVDAILASELAADFEQWGCDSGMMDDEGQQQQDQLEAVKLPAQEETDDDLEPLSISSAAYCDVAAATEPFLIDLQQHPVLMMPTAAAELPCNELPLLRFLEGNLVHEAVKWVTDTEAYYEAMEKCPQWVIERESNHQRYLEFCNYNAWEAAQRLALYWKVRRVVFGRDQAFLPLSHALTDDDKRFLERGSSVFLNYSKKKRRPNGQEEEEPAVALFVDRSRESDAAMESQASRRTCFFLFQCLSEQATEAVLLSCLWFSTRPVAGTFALTKILIQKIMCLRVVELHFLAVKRSSSNNTPLSLLRQGLISWIAPVALQRAGMLLGGTIKPVFHMEEASSLASLEQYGFTARDLPTTCCGGLWDYDTNWKSWLRDRGLLLLVEEEPAAAARRQNGMVVHHLPPPAPVEKQGLSSSSSPSQAVTTRTTTTSSLLLRTPHPYATATATATTTLRTTNDDKMEAGAAAPAATAAFVVANVATPGGNHSSSTSEDASFSSKEECPTQMIMNKKNPLNGGGGGGGSASSSSSSSTRNSRLERSDEEIQDRVKAIMEARKIKRRKWDCVNSRRKYVKQKANEAALRRNANSLKKEHASLVSENLRLQRLVNEARELVLNSGVVVVVTPQGDQTSSERMVNRG